MKILVSACLLGENCKYSGGTSSRRINAFLSLGVLKNINVVSENI